MDLHSVNMSAKWSRCPCSMTQRSRDSVAPLRQNLAGWMPVRMYEVSMLKRSGASPDPCRTPILRCGNLFRLPLAVVSVKL